MNVIIKSEERNRHVASIMDSFKMNGSDPAMRDAAEVIAARTKEAVKKGNEKRRYYHAH